MASICVFKLHNTSALLCSGITWLNRLWSSVQQPLYCTVAVPAAKHSEGKCGTGSDKVAASDANTPSQQQQPRPQRNPQQSGPGTNSVQHSRQRHASSSKENTPKSAILEPAGGQQRLHPPWQSLLAPAPPSHQGATTPWPPAAGFVTTQAHCSKQYGTTSSSTRGSSTTSSSHSPKQPRSSAHSSSSSGAALKDAVSLQQLLTMLQQDPPKDYWTVTAAFTHATRIIRGSSRQQLQQQAEQAALQQLLPLLHQLADKTKQQNDTRGLANIIWSCVYLRCTPTAKLLLPLFLLV